MKGLPVWIGEETVVRDWTLKHNPFEQSSRTRKATYGELPLFHNASPMGSHEQRLHCCMPSHRSALHQLCLVGSQQVWWPVGEEGDRVKSAESYLSHKSAWTHNSAHWDLSLRPLCSSYTNQLNPKHLDKSGAWTCDTDTIKEHSYSEKKMEIPSNVSQLLPFARQGSIQNLFDLDALKNTVICFRIIFWPHGGLYAYYLAKVSSWVHRHSNNSYMSPLFYFQDVSLNCSLILAWLLDWIIAIHNPRLSSKC